MTKPNSGYIVVPHEELGSPTWQQDMSAVRRTYYDDFRLLQNLMVNQDFIDPHLALSLGAPIVRKWLVEGKIGLVAQELNRKVRFFIPDTKPQKDYIEEHGRFVYYCAAGVPIEGSFIQGVYLREGVDDRGAGETSILPVTNIRELSLNKLQRLPILFFDGHWFTIHDCVKIMANKEGGVHIDYDSKDPKVLAFREARRLVTFGGSPGPIWSESAEVHFAVNERSSNSYDCGHVCILVACQAFLHARFDGRPTLPDPDGYWDDLVGRARTGLPYPIYTR